MKVNILYFAKLREAVGVDTETIELNDNLKVSDLLKLLQDRGEQWSEYFNDKKNLLRVAINQKIVDSDFLISDGDEIAIFPPVTGG